MRKFRLAAVLILAVLLLCGCGEKQQLRLDDMPVVVTVDMDNGARLTIPDGWEILSMTDEATVFCNADNSLSLAVLRELAGFSYYSADGLADLGEQLLGSALGEDMQVIEREALSKPEGAVLVTATGKVADGEAVGQAVVASPLSAVRYFMVVTANSSSFSEYRQVLRDIYATFELNMTEDELYQLLPEE